MATIRKEKFVPGEFYHIYSRIVFNNPEFKSYKNAERLALNFWIANSTISEKLFQYLRNSRNSKINREKLREIMKQGEKIVDVVCYSIMPDHYHLLLRERKENGIFTFIHKCNTAVAKYINTRNERRGPLFESRFKSKHINTNKYLLHLSLYIHLNPLDFITGRAWREHGIKNWNSIKTKLFKYPWSSLRFFISNTDDCIVSGTDILKNQFENHKDYEKFLQDWSEEDFNKLRDIV